MFEDMGLLSIALIFVFVLLLKKTLFYEKLFRSLVFLYGCVISYFLLLLFILSRADIDAMNTRFLSPYYPIIFLIIFSSVDIFLKRLKRFETKVFIFSFFVLVIALNLTDYVKNMRQILSPAVRAYHWESGFDRSQTAQELRIVFERLSDKPITLAVLAGLRKDRFWPHVSRALLYRKSIYGMDAKKIHLDWTKGSNNLDVFKDGVKIISYSDLYTSINISNDFIRQINSLVKERGIFYIVVSDTMLDIVASENMSEFLEEGAEISLIGKASPYSVYKVDADE
jgi:hypothetical protein